MNDYRNHGKRHRSNGSDPLPGIIVFDADNVGGWLHIETNDVDGDALTLKIVASNGGDTYWYPSGTGQDKNSEMIIYGDGGSSFALYSGGGVEIGANDSASPIRIIKIGGAGGAIEIENQDDGGTTITDIEGGLTLTGAPFLAQGDGSFAGMNIGIGYQSTGITVDLISGKSLSVRNHSGSEIFKITDAGEVFAHLPTSAGTAGSLWNDGGVVSVA